MLRPVARSSWEFEVGVFVAFAGCPLGYITIAVDVKAVERKDTPRMPINRLSSRCSNTLAVSGIYFRDERVCKL